MNIEFLPYVLAADWPPLRQAPMLFDDVEYPPAIFPVLATLRHMRLLTTDSSERDFENAKAVIATEFPKIGQSLSQKFVLSLAFYLVVESWRLDAERTRAMLEVVGAILDQNLRRIIHRSLRGVNVLINRLVTAAFESDRLLQDFKAISQTVRTEFALGDCLSRFLIKAIMWSLERRILNKLMENPGRFTFQNAMAWNAFINVFENDERVPMALLRQGMSALVLAPEITHTPEAVREFCPDLAPATVAFFLANYQPDASMPGPIDVALFIKTFGIKQATDAPEKLPVTPPIEFEELRAAARLQNWYRIDIEEDCLASFPFLADYIAEKGK
jgi:hypothetical protein